MINERAVTIQKAVRGWVARKRFVRQRQSAVIIQKTWRGFEQRKRYKQVLFFSFYFHFLMSFDFLVAG